MNECSDELLHLCHFTPLKIPGTYKPGGWVGPRAGPDILEKRKTSCLCWDRNPGLSKL